MGLYKGNFADVSTHIVRGRSSLASVSEELAAELAKQYDIAERHAPRRPHPPCELFEEANLSWLCDTDTDIVDILNPLNASDSPGKNSFWSSHAGHSTNTDNKVNSFGHHSISHHSASSSRSKLFNSSGAKHVQ